MIRPTRLYAATMFASAFTLSAVSSPVAADVVRSEDNHFVTRAEAVVAADTKATWLALISPARWWSDEHTWSADAANLTLVPQAGGCFCETIPEVADADRITLEGSVEHMRVIQAYPERALRMAGALGPLQSEPVAGVLTIALSEADGGTRIVWEYNVAGAMRYETADIAKAVDGVITLQLARLADQLGLVEGPAALSAQEAGPDTGTERVGDADKGSDGSSADPDVRVPREEGPSVDDAFADLEAE